MAYKKEQLLQCFKDALALPAGTIIEELQYQGHPSWDSVGHMRLIAALESVFNVEFSTDEILDMSSFETAVSILSTHGVAFDK